MHTEGRSDGPRRDALAASLLGGVVAQDTYVQWPLLPTESPATFAEAVGAIDVFPWITDFETNVLPIDQQHRTLVRLLNSLVRNRLTQSDPFSCDEIFHELSGYAIRHFETEEALMQQYSFGNPDSRMSGNRMEHQEFFREIGYLVGLSNAKPAAKTVEDVVSSLSRWLAYHILDVNRRMAKVVQSVRAGSSIEAARLLADSEMSGAVKGLIDSVLGIYEQLSSRTFELMREIAERQRVEGQSSTLRQIEWEHIQRALLAHKGNISATARALKMHRRTLQRKLHRPKS